jgi:hypothetical protein
MITLSCYHGLSWQGYNVVMITLSCYHDSIIMLSWQHYHVIITALSCYHDSIIMLSWQHYRVIMTALSCYHDSIIMLSWQDYHVIMLSWQGYHVIMITWCHIFYPPENFTHVLESNSKEMRLMHCNVAEFIKKRKNTKLQVDLWGGCVTECPILWRYSWMVACVPALIFKYWLQSKRTG